MKELEERIARDGVVRSEDVLKVGAFLNHQCDVSLFRAMGDEWARLFRGVPVDKILTIEASGIGIACVAALSFGGVPVVFAKKAPSVNLSGGQLSTEVYSFTKQRTYPVIVERDLLNPGERVLIIDDFLARGCALDGLIRLCGMAGAEVQGIGVAIEKAYQGGGDRLRKAGWRVESLARISSLDAATGGIAFM